MTQLRFAGDLPPWVVLSLALFLALLAWLLYRRELRQGVWGFVLPGLRALAVLLIVLMLAGPELVHTSGLERRGRVVLLLDTSASMGVSDPQMPQDQKLVAAKALGVDESAYDKMSRLERAERIVLDLDKGLLSKLRGTYDLDLVELRGSKPELIWSSSQADAPPDELATGTGSTSTDLGLYITRALADSQEVARGRLAFALISDGRHNQGQPLGQVAVGARAAGAPVFSIAVGSELSPHDLSVMTIDSPPTVFPDDRISGKVSLLDAMPAGQAFTLEIVSGSEVLWSAQQVTIGGSVIRTIDFDFPAQRAVELARQATPEGLKQNQLPLPLSARVTGLKGDVESRNDSLAFAVRAVTGKRRMLILAGRARWEMRYLDAMFSRDPRWEVTALMGGPGEGRRWPRADEGEAFPRTRDKLMGYDVVVLGELPAGTLSDGELQWLYEFVANRAGGLIAIDGRRGSFASYAKSPIAPLLPQRLEDRTLRPSQLQLTAEGRRNPTLRIEPEADLNARTWSMLPAPSYVAPIKPSVGIDTVLVEAVVGGQGTDVLPAVVTRRVGAGWVWYSAIDETWRWRRDVESLYQNRYWHQVTNRVVEPLYAAEDRYVSLGVDDAVVDAGSEIPVRVRLRDEAGKPRLTAKASVYLQTLEGERVVRVPLTPDAVEGGRFSAELEASVVPGVYRVGVEVEGVSESELLASTLVTVRGSDLASGELADVTLNRDLLANLAQTTGGAYLSESEAGKLPDLLTGLSSSTVKETVSALWQSWPWFAAIVGLLAIEFLARRRLGML